MFLILLSKMWGRPSQLVPCLGYSIYKFSTPGLNLQPSGCVVPVAWQPREVQNAEIPDLVHSLRNVLAAGAGRTGSLSDSVAAVVAVPGCRNCGRVRAGSGMGAGGSTRPAYRESCLGEKWTRKK